MARPTGDGEESSLIHTTGRLDHALEGFVDVVLPLLRLLTEPSRNLSHYIESSYALRLLEDQPERCGYLKQLLWKPCEPGPLDALTERERDVLGAMAEGHSNDAIARLLFV